MHITGTATFTPGNSKQQRYTTDSNSAYLTGQNSALLFPTFLAETSNGTSYTDVNVV